MISVKYDPWVIPSPNLADTWGDITSLSLVEINYVEIVFALDSVPTNHTVLSASLDVYSQSPWLGSLDSPDPFTETFPSNESMMEVKSPEEAPWNDTHHCSSFFLGPKVMSNCLEIFSSHFLTQPLQMPIMTHEFRSEGNMGNISLALPVYILVYPDIIKIF